MKCVVVLTVCLLQLWAGANAQNNMCGKTMDPAELCILLDSTHSIKSRNWPVMKHFIKDVVDRIDYAQDRVRIGAIQWAKKSRHMVTLDEHPTVESMKQELDEIPFKPGGGHVHKALDLMRTETLSKEASRPGVARIGILVIDEESHEPEEAQIAAQELHADGIKMIVIGIERRRFNYEELLGIAGGEVNVLLRESVHDLDTPEFLDDLMGLICAEAAPERGSGDSGSGDVTTEAPIVTTSLEPACELCDQWTAPAGWTGGQPDYYKSFENTRGMTLHNGAQLKSGKVGNGISMDKSLKQWVDMGHVSNYACFVKPSTCSAEGGTFSAWINFDYGFGFVISSLDKIPSVYTEGFYVDAYHTPWLGLDSKTFAKTVRNQQRLDNDWYHVVFVYYGPIDGGCDLYINGVKNRADIGQYDVDKVGNEGKLVLGRKYTDDDSKYATAELDEILFWNRALTEQEAQDLYNSYQ